MHFLAHGRRQANILILMEWYDHHIRKGIGRYALEHNWHLTIDERAEVPRGWQGDGILTVFNKRKDIIDYVQHQDVPVVDMGLYHPKIKLPRVTGDCMRIGALAAEHFAERGFQHTAWFASVSTPIEKLRYEGFKEGCRKLGLHEPLQWVWEAHSNRNTNNWETQRAWLEQQLQGAPEPLAVLAFNDYDASIVLYVCQNANIDVPEKIAILGVDDNQLICLNQPVPLSSIIHDLNRVGYEASQLLDRLIHGATPPTEPILIPPKGIELRRSTDYTAINILPMRRAISFIKANIRQSFGIDEVATYAEVSRSTLDRLFRENLNRTVYAEVHRTRLSTAKSLLTTTSLPLHEIAMQTGFCHAQHLNNLFKHTEGITPKVFRKRYK